MAAIAPSAGRLLGACFGAVMNLPERPMRWAQSRLRDGRLGWLFVGPNLAVFGLFTFLPIAVDFWYSLTGSTELLPKNRPYVGLDNFTTLLACGEYLDPNSCVRDTFWYGVWNTAKFVLLQVGLMISLSLLTALVLNRKIIGRGVFRAVFFYPVLLSPVVVALIWKWILQRDGVLNAALRSTGVSSTNWLLDPNWAFFWTVFVSIWAHMGFYTLILLAGLQAIPRDIYEAANMDAASPWRTFYRLTLPLLMPSLVVVFILGMIRAVQIFDEVYVLTGGGPGTATTFMVEYIYNTGFAQSVREYGMAAAASLLLAGVLLVFTALQLKGLLRVGRGSPH
ncbi:MAG TPA: sugar ABC transporter permease [Stellaceae bacterium]|jgi:alpha-1,4-digalacturonate transport system permease protein|nr:sugar ABC transporter permease [Stellaceae bacterium]